MSVKDWFRKTSRTAKSESAKQQISSPGSYFKIIPLAAVPGFVCYLDILGYSDFVLHSDLKASIDDLAVLRSILLQSARLSYQDQGLLCDDESMSKYVLNQYDYSLRLPFYYALISDSVLYWGMTDIDKLVVAMKSAAFSICMIAIRQNRFVRGAVAHGTPVINPFGALYYGKPIVEAVGMEKNMRAPGIIIPLKYLSSEQRSTMVEHVPYFVPCLYRYKNGMTESCLYVNWLFQYVRERRVEGFSQLLEVLVRDGLQEDSAGELIEMVKNNPVPFPFPVPE